MKARNALILTVLVAAVGSTGAYAARIKPGDTSPPGVPPGQPFQALQREIDDLNNRLNALQNVVNQNLIGAHHSELSFDIPPGGQAAFPLPKVQHPVRVEVSFSLLNQGTQTPSEVMYAVVNQDPLSGQMTWVGTNNDASMQAGNTPASTLIAQICGGTCPTVNASLIAQPLAQPPGNLVLQQNASTTIVPGHYVVHLWF
jgi:hypothetical protein